MIALPKATDSLADLAELWIADSLGRLGRHPHEANRGRRSVRGFAAAIGATTIEHLRPLAVQQWLAERAKVVSPHTLRNDLSSLRGFGDWLVTAELWPHNPLRSIRMKRAPTVRGSRPLSYDETLRLLKVVLLASESTDGRIAGHAKLRWRFYLFLARTGLRFNEARMQRWEDVDLDRGELAVTKAKTGDRARIPLDGETLGMLREWRSLSTGDLVFPRTPSHRVLERDMRAAGIPEAPGQWHRLRKFSVTERARRGAQLRELQSLARHADPKMTQAHYDYVEADEVRRAAELLPSLSDGAKAAPLPELSRDDAELVASPSTFAALRRAVLEIARRRIAEGEHPGAIAAELGLSTSTTYAMRAAARGQSFREGKKTGGTTGERPAESFPERKRPDESAVAGAGESCPVRKKSDGADDDRKAECFPKRKKSGGAAGGGRKESFPVRKKTGGAGAGSGVESFPSRKKSGRAAVAAKVGIEAAPKGRSEAASKGRATVVPVAAKRGGGR